MARLDDWDILQPEHLVGYKLSRAHDLLSVPNLDISWFRMHKCQGICRATNEHLAWLDLRET
jgi:hypothetical protein